MSGIIRNPPPIPAKDPQTPAKEPIRKDVRDVLIDGALLLLLFEEEEEEEEEELLFQRRRRDVVAGDHEGSPKCRQRHVEITTGN
jgi:hypothetical protein